MTGEELDAEIAEIIIPQFKPKSTGNSHRRKQFENRRNWQRVKMGHSRQLGSLKYCNDDNIYSCAYDLYYSRNSKRYKKIGWIRNHFKNLQKKSERSLRHYKGNLKNGSYYKYLFIVWTDRW